MKARTISGISILFVVQCFAFSTNDYKLERVAINQKLTQNTINCIYQDHLGYLWIGTHGGLNRYGGESIETFIHDPHDSSSIPNNIISGLFEDAEGTLFVAANSGLASFDRTLKKWSTFCTAKNMGCTIQGNRCAWLPTNGQGLLCYNFNTGKLLKKHHNASDSLSIASNSVISFFIDDAGQYWIGYDSCGLENYSPDWLIKKKCPLPKSPHVSNRYKINTITQDSFGRIWVGTEFHGLLISEKDKLMHPANAPDIHLPARLRKDTTIFSFLAEKNHVWIGAKSGFYLYDVELDSCLSFFPFSKKRLQESPRTISRLYIDRQGIIWAGGKNALYKITQQIKIKHYNNFLTSRPAEQNRIWTFLAEGDSVWVGTALGLLKWSRLANQFSLFQPNEPISPVRSIVRASANSIYVLTLASDLFEFDTQREKFIKKTKIIPNPALSSSAYCALLDRDGSIWLGLNAAGLYHYSPATGDLHGYPHSSRIITNWIIDMKADTVRHCLWCGTWQAGLWQLDLKTQQIRNANAYLPQYTEQGAPTILCIDIDRHGALWLGTDGDGLIHLNPTTKKVESFTTRDGLPSNIIYSIIIENEGHLWLSTTKGLAHFNTAAKWVKSYNMQDGLQGREFNVGAAAKTPQGELLFGGDNGFNLINPRQRENAIPPHIVLDDIKLFGESMPISPENLRRRAFTFSYKESFISLDFSVLHFKNPDKNQLKYRFNNISDQWINLGRQREISLMHAEPGDYHLELLAANSDGVWMSDPYRLTIKITPPYWKTAWFYIGISLALSLFAGGALALLQQRRLEIQRIKERERDDVRRRLAADFHDEVGHRLTKIAMISRLLRQKLYSQEKKNQLSRLILHANAIYAEMRDFIWEIDDDNNTLYHLLSQINIFGEQVFEDEGIAFKMEGIDDDFSKTILPTKWRENLLRIFKEAMHNALKHSRATKVTFTCRRTAKNIMLQVCDDGVGFDEANIDKINGLQHIKTRCKEIGAHLVLNAKKGRGVCITTFINLP